MRTIAAQSRGQLRRFFRVAHVVYRNIPQHRSTEDDVCEMLVRRRTVFYRHAHITNFLLVDGDRDLGRFSLVVDDRLPGWVQVAFLEFLPELRDPYPLIRSAIAAHYPAAKRVVVGLSAHLNYGAGFLADSFDQPPVFGLPYTPPYYLDAFSHLKRRPMVSYRFPSQIFLSDRFARFESRLDPEITVRYMDRLHSRQDIEIYTDLNNACFQNHPFWADRSAEEDFELFHPFRFLLQPENLILAFHRGKPVGFLLWYPDFNELVKGDRRLGPLDVARFRLKDPIRTIRFTEVAVHPDYASKPVVLAMIMAMREPVRRAGYETVEGGFIFEDNVSSTNMALRFIQRAAGSAAGTTRTYVLFEEEL